MGYKIGIIGMIREELEQDRWGTLKRIAEAGYRGIESPPWARTEDEAELADCRKRLDDLGMEVVAINCSQYKEEELPATIERAKALGCGNIVTYWAGPESDDEAMKLAEQLERMATTCENEGLRFMYHNHDHEFAPGFGKNGKQCLLDLLRENTEKLTFELDIAWAQFGGSDPVELIRRMGDRVPVLHVKDIWDETVRGRFCAIGLGKVDCFGSIEAAAAKGTQWMVVEEDRPCLLSHYESAIASIYNIRESGVWSE